MIKVKLKSWGKNFLIVGITLLFFTLVVDLIIGLVVFNFTFRKGGFSRFINNSFSTSASSLEWLNQEKSEVWKQETSDKLILKAQFYPADQETNKTVIVLHGFGSNSKQMAPFIQQFHSFGYNVLAPDSRAAGSSDGEYIGYGWGDRQDLVKWINVVNKKYHNKDEIGLFGFSMGASEVLFTLGKPLHNVKFAIADSGYASIVDEMEYQLHSMFGLPSFPLIPTTDIYSIFLAHYNLYDANTKTTLAHNKIPLLIIHSIDDNFVPVSNAKTNYANDKEGPKELWIVPGNGHGNEIKTLGDLYTQRVKDFTDKYFQ